jgi:hypothetical protein
LSKRLEPRGDVDAIAVDVVILVMMSPRLIPIRNRICRSGGMSRARSAMPACSSTAQRTASTTLANSTRAPSPMSLTMRPWCSAILGSMNSLRCALSAASVPAWSAAMSRE